MKTVQASAAKTHLLSLLDEVERGAEIVITRHGKPIARLSPEVETRRQWHARATAVLADIRRHTKPLPVEEILAAREQGRRF